jgi:hypothetical protein
MAREQLATKPKTSSRKRRPINCEPENPPGPSGPTNWDAAPKPRADRVGRGDRNIGSTLRHVAQAQPIWISVAAAAERAGVNPRTIKRWISNGWLSANRLPSPKGMGQLRVRLGGVEALIARGALS